MGKKGFAHRAGYRLGKLLRTFTRRETLIVKSLAMKGVPSVVTATMIWIVKLLLLGVLLYFTLWAALFYATLVFFGALQSRGLVFPEAMKNDDGLRHGTSGYGDYSGDFRVDAGRFDEEK